MEQRTEAGVCPRVLVVDVNPLGRKGAQGITVSNLFSGWDPGALGQIFLADMEPDRASCQESLKLGESVYPVDYCIRTLLGRVIKVDDPLTHKIGGIGPSRKDKLSPRVRLHLMARAISDFSPCFLDRKAIRWIQDFRPDVIYSCLGSARLMKLALKVSEAAGDVPIIPHFMDDWPSTLYADGRLCGIPRKALVRLLRRVFQHAPLGFCIGKAMAEVFKARYGLDFYDFMNCVDDEEFEDNSCSCNSRPEHTVWAYVGGLHLNRWEPLVVLAGCLMTRRITLRIFIPEHDISEYGFHFSGFSNVEMGSLPPGAVMKAMKESDVLVHVESFNQEESEYTRYSVSTKLAQYLSSGRTVLGFGPAGLASVKLIEEAGAGISVVREDLNELARAVDKIANDARFRENCARQGILYASRHFKKSIVCRRFRQMLKPADVAIGKTVQNEVINKM